MGIPSLPSFYQNAISGYFGNLTTDGQEALWESFLDNSGLTPSSPLNTASNQQKFISFLQTSLLRASDSLSPDEQKKRSVMLDAFDLALHMLSTLQNTVVVQSQNLIFYGKWQEQYTKMMSRVPVYIADSPTAPKLDGFSRPSPNIDAYDPTTFKVGYNDITIQEIADYVESQFPPPGNTKSFQFGPNVPLGASGIQVTFNDAPSTNVVDITVRVSSDFQLPNTAPQEVRDLQPGDSITFPPSFPPFTDVSIGRLSSTGTYVIRLLDFTPPSDAKERAKLLTDGFKAIYYNILGNPMSTKDVGAGSTTPVPGAVYDPKILPNIPNDTEVDGVGGDQAAQDVEARNRAERNARNQQFIENIRSFRQVVQDTAKTVESNLGSTREALSQQSNLLSSIMDSMKSIIGAIFKA